jgi:formamidopyrimidine-DNA glycosylase
MPELPEVETVRLTLLPHLEGRSIIAVKFGAFAGVIGDCDPERFAAGTVGRSVAGIRRRGKYLLIDFDDDSGLIVHLRMTGSLSYTDDSTEPVRFEHLRLHLDNGMTLRFADQRKFGRVVLRPAGDAQPLEGRLGPEPLEDAFNAAYLGRVLVRRTAPIKALILDQRLIAGVGNIYADEALFRSRIHPRTPGGALDERQVNSLVRSIKTVLRSGVENRGTSFSSYRDANGDVGANQNQLRIYGRGRSGEPCMRCGGPLTTLSVGGRTSHLCSRCQPLLARPDHQT